MALDADQYLRTLQREYLDFIEDDVSVKMILGECLITLCYGAVIYITIYNISK